MREVVLSPQLLLNEGVSERFFRFAVGDAFTIHVMGHFVNQNIIQITLIIPIRDSNGSFKSRRRLILSNRDSIVLSPACASK